MSTKKNRTHSEEFKQEAVRPALASGKPKAQVALELDISEGLLYTWISKYDEARSRGLTVEEYQQEKAKMRRLKAENKRLQVENSLLKKASAYFAIHLE